MNAATEVKRHKLTQEDCDTVRYLLKYGRTLKEIAEIIKVDPSTVGKIRLANYDLPTYLEQRKAMNRKTKENKARAVIRRMEELEKREQTMAGVKPMSRWPKLSEVFPSVAEESAAEAGRQTPQGWKKAVDQELKDQGWDEVQKKLPEVPGQMKMDLDQQAEEPEKHDDSKQMKFQAAMVDKLVKGMTEAIVAMIDKLTVLDEIRDVLKGGAGNE